MPPTTLRQTWGLPRQQASYAPSVPRTPRPRQPTETEDERAARIRAEITGRTPTPPAPVSTISPTPGAVRPTGTTPGYEHLAPYLGQPNAGQPTQGWSGAPPPTGGTPSSVRPYPFVTPDENIAAQAEADGYPVTPYTDNASEKQMFKIGTKKTTGSKTTYLPNNPRTGAVDPGTNRKGSVEVGALSGLPDWETFVTSEPAASGAKAIPNPTGYIKDNKGWLLPTYLNSDKNTAPTGGPMVKDEEYWIQKKLEADKSFLEWKEQREAGTTTDFESPDGGIWKVFTPSDGSEPKYTKVGQKPPVDNNIYTDEMRDADFKFLIRDVGYNALFLEQLKTASVAQFRNLVNLEKDKFAQNRSAKNQLENTASALFDIPMDEQTRRKWSAAANAQASQQSRSQPVNNLMTGWANTRQR